MELVPFLVWLRSQKRRLWSGLEKYLIRRSLRAFPQTAGPVRL